MANESVPRPQYTLWQCLSVSLALARRAIEEVRALSLLPGPQGEVGPEGKRGPRGDPGPEGVRGEPGREGKEGKKGVDGQDGFGFDDLEGFEDEFSYGINFRRGDQIKEVVRVQKPKPPNLADMYAGVWRGEKAYSRGTVATLDGSLFIAMSDTETRPGVQGSDWVLAVKRGRDGKDGAAGKPGERGAEGKSGRDLTQRGPDGSKW